VTIDTTMSFSIKDSTSKGINYKYNPQISLVREIRPMMALISCKNFAENK
jgi:hypothetical protein